MVRLKADPNVGGVSHNGREYPLVDGFIMVPEEAARDLLGFGWGFTLAEDQGAAREGAGPPAIKPARR